MSSISSNSVNTVNNAVGPVVSTVVDNTVGPAATQAANTTGLAAREEKTVVHGVTDTVTSGVKTVTNAMPFDVLGFIADFNSKMPEVFHIPLITGEDRKYSAAQSRYNLSSFEIYGQSYFSRDNLPEHGTFFGGGLSWNPTLHLKPGQLDLRAHLGNSRLMQGGHGLFGDLETKILASFIVKEAAFFEFGPLLRHYYAHGNGWGLAANTGIWLGDRKLLHILDRFLFGLNFVGNPGQGMTWEYRFGIGITVF